MRYLNQGIMILIALRTLFHCALTAKITETISDGNYIEKCNHLQDKWSLTYIFCPYCPWIMFVFFPLCSITFKAWTLLEAALATSSCDYIGKSNRIHAASLQQHLGVPRALGILSLRAAPSHPVREQRQPMCQSAVTKEWHVDWQLKES